MTSAPGMAVSNPSAASEAGPEVTLPWRGPGEGRPDLPFPPARQPLLHKGLMRKRWRYVGYYGEEIMHGDTPFNVEGLVALAGWHGGLGDDEAKRLRYALARAGTDDRGAFVAELKKGSAA